MATATSARPELTYEGPGDDAEAWGFTQANFTVRLAGRRAREVALMLNFPAAAYIAEALGREDTPDFRRAAARAVGEARIPAMLKRGAQLDPLVTVSKAVLESEPELLEKLRKTLKA